ncbi:MAG: recombinase family protein, partial [Chloroflexota bacterium]
MKVAVYARVSSESQDVEQSISAQLKALRKYASDSGHIVVAEYVDEAESGRSDRRPQFQAMMAAARSNPPEFDAVLVWKLDRFARDVAHATAARVDLRRRGVRLISINEQFGEGPSATLMETISHGMAQYYSDNLAQDVTRGMREAVEKGYWVGSTVPYGYRRERVQDGGKTRSRLVPDEDTAPVLRRIFAMAHEGHGAKDIAARLNTEGVPSSSGKRWGRSRVGGILRNEVYVGTVVWGKRGKYHKEARLEPVVVEDGCPALVEREVFDAVQASLDARSPGIQ